MEGLPAAAGRTVVLSRRADPFVGWVAIDEFENLLADVGGARIVVPEYRAALPRWAARVRDRWLADVSVRTDPGEGDMLLVVARTPRDLQGVRAVSGVRKRFRHVVGYVIDSYFHEGYGSSTRLYDHVFTTTSEAAEFVRRKFGIPSSVLHQGFDCLNWNSVADSRSIDLLGFGRQPASYHRAFQAAFHRQDSPLLYLHSPIGSIHGPAVWTERPMMLKLMQQSKIALAFHLLVEPEGSRPKAAGFVTSRWFEQLTAGCVVMGKRPSMALELFDWPDATIELPDEPAAAVETLAEIAADAGYLATTRRRNVLEMCKRHDWRYRLRDIFGHFDLPMPPRLVAELGQLAARIQVLSASAGNGRTTRSMPAPAPSD